jgi:hypothetical protein
MFAVLERISVVTCHKDRESGQNEISDVRQRREAESVNETSIQDLPIIKLLEDYRPLVLDAEHSHEDADLKRARMKTESNTSKRTGIKFEAHE